MASRPPPLPPTFVDQVGFPWALSTLDSLPAACPPTLLALFRPSAQEARATIVLSAGKTATPLARAAAVLARFGRGRLERELSDPPTHLSSCRGGLGGVPAPVGLTGWRRGGGSLPPPPLGRR